jgi:hypothetical protein
LVDTLYSRGLATAFVALSSFQYFLLLTDTTPKASHIMASKEHFKVAAIQPLPGNTGKRGECGGTYTVLSIASLKPKY